MHALARYVTIDQKDRLVPIVKPEVLMEDAYIQ
ncbi:class I fructose-bisphosphate aldolase [Spirosoma aureum]